MKKIMKNEKGFTLIELIIVIAILAIIAAVAIPNILNAVDNSRKSADVANAKIILNAAAQVNAKNPGLVAEDISDLSAIKPPATVGATPASFSEALAVELNNAVPKPKYKGGAVSAVTTFSLVVNADGTMSVTAGTTKVAPTPDSLYDQQ